MTSNEARLLAILLVTLSIGTATAKADDLQSAISTSRVGDTIWIPAGIHEGNLLVDKRLVLIGGERSIVHGTGEGSVITITADSCVVQGLVVEHSGTMLVNEDAGILVKSNHNRIAGNALRDVLFGIYLFHSERNITTDNQISGRRPLDVGERGSGIHVWNSNFNTFVGNEITDMRDGFYIQNASHLLIENNEVHNLRYGLHYMYADSNVFLYNRFHDNVAGAAIMYCRGIIMRHNVFSHNRGFASFGILFQDCHGLRADSNVVSDNVVGMFLEASTNNCFRHNVIAQNDVALQMFQNSINNIFTENNFIDNLNPLSIVGKRTETRWSENGRGNFWTQYDGYDLDDDGVGDISMKIQNVFNYLEGQNANTRLYLYSPASQALAVAGRAFPIMDVSEEMDAHPLVRPITLRDAPAVMHSVELVLASTTLTAPPTSAWIVFPFVGVAALSVVYYRLARRRVR